MKRKETNHRQVAPTVRSAHARPSGVQNSRREHQLEFILESTTECYGTWDLVSGQMCFSNQWLTALGYSAADSRKGHELVKSLLHPEDKAAFESALKAHLAGKVPTLDCEFRLRTRNGSYRWFQIRGKVARRDRTGIPLQLTGLVLDIQGRKQKEEELARSRDQLSSMLQASQDSIALVDPVRFGLIAFNKSFEEVIFRARGLHLYCGMRPEDINPTTAEKWNEFYRQVLEKGRASRDYPLHSIRETHHVFAQCLVRNGQVQGICVFGHDITNHKEMEAALRLSEEKFQKVFRESPLAISLTSVRDHRYIEVNDAYLELTGYGLEELAGKTPLDIAVWAKPEQQMEMIKDMLWTGDVRNREILYRTKSGEIREAIGSAALIDINGEPCMLGVNVDITDRKRASQAVRESEERLRIAIEAGHMYSFEWDVATDVVQRSRQSIAMLDLPDDGSMHTRLEFIERIQPEHRQKYIGALKSLTPEKPNYKAVFRLRHRSGRTVWLEESGRAIFEPDGKLRKVIGIASDVTESRESERMLRELSRRLITSQEEERCRIARELHDHIGQETALLCMLAQRIDSGEADAEQMPRSDVHELYRRIKALGGDISKLSHRLHSSELTFLGLEVAAERLCRDFAEQYGIDIDYQVKSLPPTLDRPKSLCLYRVLQEALQNVGKHSHSSQVVVELQTIGDEVALEVKDNGEGFDIEKTGFESGLGLLSMRERLNLVGGRFAIVSRPGAGTKLTANVMA